MAAAELVVVQGAAPAEAEAVVARDEEQGQVVALVAAEVPDAGQAEVLASVEAAEG